MLVSCTAQVAPAAEGGGSGLYGVRNTDAAFGLVQQFATAMRACALPHDIVLPICDWSRDGNACFVAWQCCISCVAYVMCYVYMTLWLAGLSCHFQAAHVACTPPAGMESDRALQEAYACMCNANAETQGLHRASVPRQGCRDRQAALAPVADCSTTWVQSKPGTGSAPVLNPTPA